MGQGEEEHRKQHGFSFRNWIDGSLINKLGNIKRYARF
jgi:hypothetical protein